MRYLPIMMVCVAAGAMAQSAPYGNPDVIENPSGPSAGVLLYPGGQYGRIVRNDLREPDESETAVPSHARPPRKTLAPAPKADLAPTLAVKPAKSVPQKVAPPPQVAVARAEPPKPASAVRPASTGGTILFDRNATDPRGTSVLDIGKLADGLNGALTKDRSRVQITAFAGTKGDTTANARRLSLKRALIVRQLLIDGGVPADRIDVRAVGASTDNGVPDRVDVSVKG